MLDLRPTYRVGDARTRCRRDPLSGGRGRTVCGSVTHHRGRDKAQQTADMAGGGVIGCEAGRAIVTAVVFGERPVVEVSLETIAA